MTSDIEIARRRKLLPIEEIAAKAGVPGHALYRYGPTKAKIDLAWLGSQSERPRGRLILVTAVNPTPPGEGKTTTTIGLGDALNRIGKRALVALREPSLGPVFGRKGGATGGGQAQVAPMEEINLHFTGDFHAIGAAHNLLAALVDNHLYWGNALGLDPRSVVWRRVVDMNDRALRDIVVGLGGNGPARETGFDITVASEVMAVLCLAENFRDLEARLARMVIGRARDGRLVSARDLGADGAMAALLKDAMAPNLVQTLEGTPALLHGGPFANIAHGCNSVIATTAALALGDYAVTEAGFGADLGAEKFLDIKCRISGLRPSAAVVVATLRALKYQGGAGADTVSAPNAVALESGLANLARHIENLKGFGLPVVVAINHFAGDKEEELARVAVWCEDRHGVEAIVCRHWAQGAAGAEDLAHAVVRAAAPGPVALDFAYPDAAPLTSKVESVARRIYRAGAVSFAPSAEKALARFEKDGFGGLPVCIAKTPYSFSADETLLGAPTDHVLPVREARLSAGAGFVAAICGDVMTMPGLPKAPNAARIRLDGEGQIDGLS